jgi:hypothetical protein
MCVSERECSARGYLFGIGILLLVEGACDNFVDLLLELTVRRRAANASLVEHVRASGEELARVADALVDWKRLYASFPLVATSESCIPERMHARTNGHAAQAARWYGWGVGPAPSD